MYIAGSVCFLSIEHVLDLIVWLERLLINVLKNVPVDICKHFQLPNRLGNLQPLSTNDDVMNWFDSNLSLLVTSMIG